jgi:CHAT domain-containing protein/tetratricopeptide (TPR) repeat protein
VTGRIEEGTLLLETTTRLNPADVHADWWIGLSAAHYARADAARVGLDLAVAADAASHAVRLRKYVREALFNRALAAERLQLRDLARRDLAELIPLEGDDGWREEARRRLTQLGSLVRDSGTAERTAPRSQLTALVETSLPAWEKAADSGDPIAAHAAQDQAEAAAATLAAMGDTFGRRAIAAQRTRRRGLRAWSQYKEAREQAAAGQSDRARAILQTILTSAPPAAPVWLAANVAYAFASNEAAQPAIAREALHASERAIRPGDTLFQADLETLAARLAAADNDVLGALARYRSATAAYDRLGEHQTAATVRAGLCYFLHALGDHDEEWTERAHALGALDTADALTGYLIAASAALGAQREHLSSLAADLQDLAVRYSDAGVDQISRIEAIANRANMRSEVGDGDGAAADARNALALLGGTPDNATTRLLRANIHLHLPLTPSSASDPNSVTRLSEAIELYEGRHRVDLLALAYHRRGLFWASAGNYTKARQDFLAGASTFAAGARTMRDPAQRARYFDSAIGLLDALVSGHIRGDRLAGVFQLSDEIRADADVPAPDVIVTPAALQSSLPAGAALLYYISLPRRLVIICVRSDGTTTRELPVDRTWLAWTVSIARGQLEGALTADVSVPAAQQLFKLLIEPVAVDLTGIKTLVLSRDDVVAGVPFPVLYDQRRGRFLVEDYELASVDSARAFLTPDAGALAAGHHVTVVGAGNSTRLNGSSVLPALPEVESETHAIADLYPGARLLTGRDATVAAVRRELVTANVFHFAGHALDNDALAGVTGLVLESASGGARLLPAADIAGLDLRNAALVVLSACRTGAVPVGLARGGTGLTAAFRRAGARAVVGSQWNVPDRGTRVLLTEFHRRYATTGNPAAALREAQCSLLRSGDLGLRAPGVWGGFQVFSATLRGATDGFQR